MKVPTLFLMALIPVVLAGGLIDKREPKSKKSTSTTSTSTKHTSTSSKHTSTTSTRHTSTSTKSTSTKSTSTPTTSKKKTTLHTTTSAPTTTPPATCPGSRTIQCASEYLSCPCVASTIAPGEYKVEICQNIQGYFVCDGQPSIYSFTPSSSPPATSATSTA